MPARRRSRASSWVTPASTTDGSSAVTAWCTRTAVGTARKLAIQMASATGTQLGRRPGARREPVAGPREPVAGPREPVAGPREPVAGPREPVAGPREPVGGAGGQLAGGGCGRTGSSREAGAGAAEG